MANGTRLSAYSLQGWKNKTINGVTFYNPTPEILLSNNIKPVVHIQGDDIFSISNTHVVAQDGQAVEAGTIIRTSTPLTAKARTDKKGQIAASRYGSETSGVTLNGMTVKTDRESQSMLNGAFALVQFDPTKVVKWKMENGAFIQLDASAITAIAMAVTDHIEQCFNKEADLCNDIDNAITFGDIQNITWE